MHNVPQLSTELSGRHCVPHRWKPVWQVKSHTPLKQVAVPFAGGVQVWQLGPHDVIELATHTLPQKLGVVVEAQRRPQLRPSHVTVVPLPTGPSGHTAHRLPQVLVEKFETHWPLHSWYPTLH